MALHAMLTNKIGARKGSRFHELRGQHQLTQRELAAQLGVDDSYISKIEHDQLAQPPSEDLIRRFAQVVEADAEALLDRAGRLDAEVLRNRIAQQPALGVIVRRLQRGHVTREQIEQLLAVIGDTPNERGTR